MKTSFRLLALALLADPFERPALDSGKTRGYPGRGRAGVDQTSGKAEIRRGWVFLRSVVSTRTAAGVNLMNPPCNLNDRTWRALA